MKTCATCKQSKADSEFYLNPKNRDGLHSYCKPCLSARRKANTAKHPERNRARALKWQVDHPEESRVRKKRWKARHPDSVRMHTERRRVLKLGVGSDLTDTDWAWILLLHDYKCARFLTEGGNAEDHAGILTQDHIVPLSKKGCHTASNMQPLCLVCNSKKGVKTIDYRPKKVKAIFGVKETK